MDNSLDLILASAMPIVLVMPLSLNIFKPAKHNNSLIAYAQKKVANLT